MHRPTHCSHTVLHEPQAAISRRLRPEARARPLQATATSIQPYSDPRTGSFRAVRYRPSLSGALNVLRGPEKGWENGRIQNGSLSFPMASPSRSIRPLTFRNTIRCCMRWKMVMMTGRGEDLLQQTGVLQRVPQPRGPWYAILFASGDS